MPPEGEHRGIMAQLIVFVCIAIVLAVSRLVVRRAPRPEGGALALFEARHALTRLQTTLLAPALVSRFFAPDDFQFVSRASPGALNSFFRDQRRKIALSWTRQVLRQIKTLRRFHLGAARFYSHLGLLSEASLAIDFARLLVACRLLQFAIWIRGPLAAPGLVASTLAAGVRICEISERSLAFLDSPHAVVERSTAS